MRRLALIFGLLLTLTAGVWGSAIAVAAACCMDDASASNGAAAAPASDEHDCCRAKLGESNAPPSQSNEHAHAIAAATHEDAHAPKPQADAAHANVDCMGAAESESVAAGAGAAVGFVERGRSCFECCAGRGKQMPTTATTSAPEPNKVKRAALNGADDARRSFAPTASGVAHLSPSQHAPPAPGERRHKLINVFLI
ncbi:MAG TPA: hypothetical protein VGO96_07945 [Pyrinomonadaceae bacterium]|nr:hypothetical protein [Pyrinomonadaceae bacterium]